MHGVQGPAEQQITPAFETSSMTVSRAVELYEELSRQPKSTVGEPNPLLSTVVEFLRPRQQFLEVTPDAEFSGIHRRLFDKVHPPENPAELMQRLAVRGYDHRAFALAIQTETGEWYPTAVVYTYATDNPAALCRIRPIVDAPSKILTAEPRYIIPYAISSTLPGAGWRLIGELHNHVHNSGDFENPPEIVTLSPMRSGKQGLALWARDNAGSFALDGRLSDDDLMPLAWEYLMSKKPKSPGYMCVDAVEGFHTGALKPKKEKQSRGAVIAAIRPGNHDSRLDSELGLGVMANYWYPADLQQLEQNRQRLINHGILTVTPALAETVPDHLQHKIHVFGVDGEPGPVNTHQAPNALRLEL